MTKRSAPPRLRRRDSFFGLHFDLHARADMKDFGKTVTRRMIQSLIDKVRPDYIQCDCKGHPGICSYPTRVGYHVASFAKDQFRIWRDVTAANGVALYAHYSGVVDRAAVRGHPDWAAIDADDKPYGGDEPSVTSVFGPYADELMIPQLKELIDEYDIDGVWVDGDCWGTWPDYRPEALEAFRRATGIAHVPRKPTDPHYRRFMDFCREAFRRYLRQYVDELHAYRPAFQIASNWAFSTFMPEPVEAEVDFLSGDFSATDSVNSARLQGRMLASQGKPWDIMAWAFVRRSEKGPWCISTKSAVQLQQEAATVMALGGGFQAYYRQKSDGAIFEWETDVMARLASFCRARQKFCHKAVAVPQVALLLSTCGAYDRFSKLFSPKDTLDDLRGVLQCLLESQQSVQVLLEAHISGRMNDWPLIVVPEWERLEEQFVEELADYARRGGSLLLIGPACAAMFQKQLGVRLQGEPQIKARWLEHKGFLAGMVTVSQRARLGRGAQSFGRLYEQNDMKGPALPAASIARFGKGLIAATYFNLGRRYLSAATDTARKFLGDLVRELLPRPLVEVRGSQYVDVQVSRLGESLTVNLVNTAGPHSNDKVDVFDEVPPVGPLEVVIRTGRRPRSVRLEPGGRKAAYSFSRGQVRLTVDRLEIHDVIVVD